MTLKPFRLDRKVTGAHNLEGLWGPGPPGDLLYDASATGKGRGNHASREGTGPRYRDDPQRGRVSVFNGVDDHWDCERPLINTARDGGIGGLYTFTAWVWLDPTVTQNTPVIIGADDAFAPRRWAFYVNQAHLATAHLRFATTGVNVAGPAGSFHAVKGEWVHVAVVREQDNIPGFNTHWHLYQNGLSIAEGIAGGLRAVDPPTIGAGFHLLNNWWHGMIDDVRQYSRCLTPAQIWYIYQTTQYHPYADIDHRPTRKLITRHRMGHR
jgi:hypothetical protein